MKRLAMLVALLLSMVILIACTGPGPVPVIIRSDKEVQEIKK